MDQLIIDNKVEIQRQLQQLGFNNVDQLFNHAEPTYTAHDSPIAGLYLADGPLGFDRPHTAFGFSYRRIKNTDAYHLELANYSVSVNSPRNQRGYKQISRTWRTSEGPLPHKEYMQWIVAKAAKIEEAKESFLSDPDRLINSTSSAANSLPLNVELKIALKLLGFEHDPRLELTATYKDELVFLSIREKAEYPWLTEKYTANFFFAVASPEYKIPPRVEYINASLTRDDGKIEAISKERSYWLNRDELPTKERILSEFRGTLNTAKNSLQRAAEINTLIAKKPTDKGFHL